MSDYLFDKQGEPDPDVERLEGLMGALGYRGALPSLPARRPRRAFIVVAGVSAVAAALLALLLVAPWRRPHTDDRAAVASWAATVREGAATVDGRPLTGAARLSVGAWLDTGGSRVRLAVADIGSVELAPGTRVRIVATSAARQTLQLAHGTLAAVIAAPPRQFVVTTPRAVVTDLGCAFELTVDDAGRGRLAVSGGRVAVSDGAAREVVVEAGARVELSESGPGVPFAIDAVAPTSPSQAPVVPQTTQPQTTKPTQLQMTRPTQPQMTKPTHAKLNPAQTKAAHVPAVKTVGSPVAPLRQHPSATSAAPSTRKPEHGQAPQRTPATRAPDPDTQVEHDPLKALEHSVE